MALVSCMTHEETRVEEVKRVMTKEEKEPLYMRAEIVKLKNVISNHGLISNDAALAPKYIATQETTILHFEDTFRMLGTKSMQACQRRWHALPHSLHIREYHSPERLRYALEKTPL